MCSHSRYYFWETANFEPPTADPVQIDILWNYLHLITWVVSVPIAMTDCFFLSNCLLRLCYFAANAIVASPPRLLPEKQPTLPNSCPLFNRVVPIYCCPLFEYIGSRCQQMFVTPPVTQQNTQLGWKKLHLKGYLEGSSIYYVITDGGGLPKWLQYQMALGPQKVITQYMVDP